MSAFTLFILTVTFPGLFAWLSEHWTEITALILSFLTGLGFKAPRWISWIFDIIGYIFRRKSTQKVAK